MPAPLPPQWASNTNYSAGPDAGTPTKVDPASQANGFIRGVAAAAQEVNFVIDPLARALRRQWLVQACKLRRVTLEGTAITDTAESMAAVQRGVDKPLLGIKTAQALNVSDADMFFVQGVPASITSLVTGAAIATSLALVGRIVAIGTGGNRATHSDDDGATWTASANDMGLSGTGCRIVWAPIVGANGLWLAGRPGSADIHTSQTGGATGSWTTLAASLPTGVQGMAVRSDGQVVCLDAANTVAFDVGPAGGFLSTGGTVANSTGMVESGDVVGNGGALVWHVGRITGSASLQVSSSPDGVTWTTKASLTPPSGATFNARPRIMMCQNTGLLVVVCSTAGGQSTIHASLDGTDWVGPLTVMPAIGADGWAVAGGRLLATQNDMLFASDGVGF